MKKKIVILGSTGSIGNTLINIIKKNKEKFKILLLSADRDYLSLFKQAKLFNVKHLIITNKNSYELLKIKCKKNKINVYNNFDDLEKILKSKIDYTMSAITGIEGLKPTIKLIKFSKKIAIANKESIICGWNIIKNELKKFNTKFIPVDSEHFSLWYALKNINHQKIAKIYLTASGGPLLNLPIYKLKNVNINQALKHPNWKMGKKISIDSSTLMNKVFEVIEARNVFNISYKKISILTEPSSYVHAIIKYNDGMIKIIAHDTTMKIPIFNTLYEDQQKKYDNFDLKIKKLNNLKFKTVNKKQFPVVNILKMLQDKNTLFETVIVCVNDELVYLFLEKKIKYNEIYQLLFDIIKDKQFTKYRYTKVKKIEDILLVKNHVNSFIQNKYAF